MKNLKKFALLFLFLGLLSSCQNEELSNEELGIDNQELGTDSSDVKVISDYIEIDGKLVPVLDIDIKDLPDLDATKASGYNWLKGEEGDCKGHTIDKHWNKSKKYLERRSILKGGDITSFADDDVNAFYPERDGTSNLIKKGFDAAVSNYHVSPTDGVTSNARVLNVKNIIGRGYGDNGKNFKSAINKFVVVARYSVKLGRWFLLTAYPIY